VISEDSFMSRGGLRRLGTHALLFFLLVCATAALAQSPASAPTPKADTGDTAWMLTAAALSC